MTGIRILTLLALLATFPPRSAAQTAPSTLQLLKSAVWEHSKPDRGNYERLTFTDSTTSMLYNVEIGQQDVLDRKFYLTDRIEYSFDRSKVGQATNGTYFMTLNPMGGFMCYKIRSITTAKMELVVIHMGGKRSSYPIIWDYTPVKRR